MRPQVAVGATRNGFLYVGDDRLDDLEITWIGASSGATWDLDSLHFEPLKTAAKFEFGTRDKAVLGALSVAIKAAEAIGIDNIADRSWALSDRLRRKFRRCLRSHRASVAASSDSCQREGRLASSLDTLFHRRRGSRPTRRRAYVPSEQPITLTH